MRAIIIAILFAFAAPTFAHSGGTDKDGCHVDHKTGYRHCH